jgi:hypothetical protein
MSGGGSGHIDDLRAQARYHRQRYDLYKAKVQGPRETSPARLRELEHAATQAAERLAHALREAASED